MDQQTAIKVGAGAGAIALLYLVGSAIKNFFGKKTETTETKGKDHKDTKTS